MSATHPHAWHRLAAFAALTVVLTTCRRDPATTLREAYREGGERPILLRWSNLPHRPASRGAHTKEAVEAAAFNVLANGGDSATLAVANLIVGKREAAVGLLEAAVRQRPGDAALWNDYGVALFETAQKDDSPQTLVAALAAFHQSLLLSPDFAPALLNRAQTLDGLGLREAAAAATRRYLEHEQGSPWTEEAQALLEKNTRPTTREQWERVRPLLEAGQNPEGIRPFPQQARTWGEGEYLARWGKAWLANDYAGATRALALSRLIGKRLAAESGESLLHDAVAAVDQAREKNQIARAHALYEQARLLIRDRHPSAAEPILRDAERRFTEAASPMALVARYYRAGIAFDARDASTAIRLLDSIDRERREGYRALHAQTLWERSRIAGRRESQYQSLLLAQEATAIFDALGERENAARNRIGIAAMLFELGRPEDAWRVRRIALAEIAASGSRSALETALSAASREELNAGRPMAARSLLELMLASRFSSPVIEFVTRVRRLVAGIRLGESIDARVAISSLAAAAATIPDPALRADAEDEARFWEAELARRTDPARSIRLLDDAIAFRLKAGRLPRLADAYLQRAYALRETGAIDAAITDFRAALTTFETQRARVASNDLRDTFFSIAEEACAALVELHFDRGDPNQVFASGERCRARGLVDGLATAPGETAAYSVREIRHRLEPGTAMVVYARLTNRVILSILTPEAFETRAVPVGADAIEQAAARLRPGHASRDWADAEMLHDVLIRPVANTIHFPNRLIVIGDPLIAGIPLAMLRDRQSGRHLIERCEIQVVPSATAWMATRRDALLPMRRIVAVGDPAVGRAGLSLPRLPFAAAEADAIARLYPSSTVLTDADATTDRFTKEIRDADLVHVGAHAALSPRDARESAIFLASSGNDAGVLTLRHIAEMRLENAPVVVLAGCRTGVFGGGRGAIRSLAYAFLAAGGQSVIGSLWDVEDDVVRHFSIALHHKLRAGMPPVTALRNTQLEILATHRNEPERWASFQMFALH